MIRVVLDTNVLASAALTSTGPLARILTGALDADFALIIAPIIVAELERTLRKPYFAQRLGSERIAQYIARLEAVAESVAITSVVAGVATHPEDDAILAMAVSGQADYLVTGDKKRQAPARTAASPLCLRPHSPPHQLCNAMRRARTETRESRVLLTRELPYRG